MNKKWIAVFLILAVLSFLTGCTVNRRIEASEDTILSEQLPVYRLGQQTVKRDKVIETFLGLTVTELETYNKDPNCNGTYEINGQTLSMNPKEDNITFVSYEDDNEGASSCYGHALRSLISDGIENNMMRWYFPEENLDFCSKEQAIEACRPYAEACGYTDCEVTVYAATLNKLDDGFGSAPGPGYEVITWKQLNKILETEGLKAYYKANEYRMSGAITRGIPWEKKHEALILTYQQRADDYLFIESNEFLCMIYVPLYGKPVWLQASTLYETSEVIEEVSVLSEEAAVQAASLITGYSDENLKDVSLVYAPQLVIEMNGEKWEKGIPCWRVEYAWGRWTRVVLVDAQFGDEYRQYPQH